MKEQFETQRLYLCTPQEDFAPHVADFLIRNREFLKAAEPLRADSFYTIPAQREILRAQRLLYQADKSRCLYLFPKEGPSRNIGSAALNEIVRGAFHSCFLSYRLDQEILHQGYATEAVSHLVDIAFQDWNLHRIEANIMPRNLPSIRVVQRCGFTYEGTSPNYLLISGVWEEHQHYVRINQAWEPSK